MDNGNLDLSNPGISWEPHLSESQTRSQAESGLQAGLQTEPEPQAKLQTEAGLQSELQSASQTELSSPLDSQSESAPHSAAPERPSVQDEMAPYLPPSAPSASAQSEPTPVEAAKQSLQADIKQIKTSDILNDAGIRAIDAAKQELLHDDIGPAEFVDLARGTMLGQNMSSYGSNSALTIDPSQEAA